MNYCNKCGSSSIVFDIPLGDNRKRFICKNCEEIFYENPKIICGALVFDDDKLLLCRRAIEPRYGKWNLPAGFMENGETLKEGAKREVFEEANASIDNMKLHSVFNVTHVNQVYFIFKANLIDKHFSSGAETLESKLFALDEIPWDELAFYSNVFAIKSYIKNPDFEGIHHGNSIDYIRK